MIIYVVGFRQCVRDVSCSGIAYFGCARVPNEVVVPVVALLSIIKRIGARHFPVDSEVFRVVDENVVQEEIVFCY